MKKRGIFIVLPILLVLALVASPVLAKDPEPPQKGLLWEAIASLQKQMETGLAALAQQLSEGLEVLQGQIDSIQACLADVSALETQVGENILIEGEDISLLNNDAGYITEALQVENIVQVRKEKSVNVSSHDHDTINYQYNLPAGAIPISANGEVWHHFHDPHGVPHTVPMHAENNEIFPSFYESGKVLFKCEYFADNPLTEKVIFRLYYSYILD